MASFVASLSLGFMATQYNKWHFFRHFKDATHQKRLEGQRQAFAAMEFVRNSVVTGDCDASRKHKDYMYNNLQAQYDALMVEPDLRLFETHHFNSEGRMAMSAAELKFPSTPFGELRRLAIFEHGKKKRAAQFISLWYARHLVKKGFITDPVRKRQIFMSDSLAKGMYDVSEHSASRRNSNSGQSQHSGGSGNGGLWTAIRRRRKRRRQSYNSSLEPSTLEEDEGTRLDAMEKGFKNEQSPMTAPSHLTESTSEVPSRIVTLEKIRPQAQFQQIEIPFFNSFVYDQA